MAFFANAFEVPLSILIEYAQRKVGPVLHVMDMVDNVSLSVPSSFLAFLAFEVIQPENFLLQPPPLRPGVEGILISFGYQPRYLCNAVHLGISYSKMIRI